MSDAKKFDLLQESCECDDKIGSYESELIQQKSHVMWLERQIEILKEKKQRIDRLLMEEAKRRNGKE